MIVFLSCVCALTCTTDVRAQVEDECGRPETLKFFILEKTNSANINVDSTNLHKWNTNIWHHFKLI